MSNLQENFATAQEASVYTATQLHLWRAETVRSRCGEIFDRACAGELLAYDYRSDRVEAAAEYVMGVILENYPDLNIPPHSRWRHFSCGGVDRWSPIANGAGDLNELKMRATELTMISVLLDAGAGADWRYVESASGLTLSRSEGLGAASVALYAQGALCSAGTPFRVDADGLRKLTTAQLAACFQVSEHNPLIGLQERVTLLRRLGDVVASAPGVFGGEGRLGALAPYLEGASAAASVARGAGVAGGLSVDFAFRELLKLLSGVWPVRNPELGALGDVWAYPGVGANEPGAGLIPFHKLSQWMMYSLTEAWRISGMEVIEDDTLTALAEYRNGGLLLDMGVLAPKDPAFAATEYEPGAPEVVELRAMTVAVVDQLAARLNTQLRERGVALTMSQILEGGTWSAGRKLAFARSPNGAPPIRYRADGTLF
ncbi:DUF1688 family protein [Hahella sp. HN01]|uniref:DUF1688 family protein n=1 Tax=Hahella sp. HN01 TaxID=2847262 RepID=UPI001C1ED441|nr:DUF1688 family protein [Hahella sp. HN01]MBU6953817.1 URC4/urg3 family protein [Hahella sp. HN01]